MRMVGIERLRGGFPSAPPPSESATTSTSPEHRLHHENFMMSCPLGGIKLSSKLSTSCPHEMRMRTTMRRWSRTGFLFALMYENVFCLIHLGSTLRIYLFKTVLKGLDHHSGLSNLSNPAFSYAFRRWFGLALR